MVCTFYKQGNCEKGKKCKFSHDLSVERKGEKKNLYQDTREGEDEAKKKDEMDNWDEGQTIQPLPHATFAGLVVMKYLEYRKVTAGRPQQAWESQNHHRQSLQILHQRRRRRQIRLVLDVSQRRRQMHVQAQFTAWIRIENQGTKSSGEGADG